MPSSYAAGIDLSLTSLLTASAEAESRTAEDSAAAWLWQFAGAVENDSEGS
jgi:hypothetical protein